MAPTGRVRFRHADKRGIPSRQVDCRRRCQWQPGCVQRPPPLYLLRGYRSRSNNWRRVRWYLACLHTESDVGISFLYCLCLDAERKRSPGAPFLSTSNTSVSRRGGCSTGRSWHASPGFILFLSGVPTSCWDRRHNLLREHRLSRVKAPSPGS